MKKRLFMVLAVLALAVCLLPMVVAADTVDPATCSHEGATYTEIPTTGTHTMSCSACGATATEQCPGCDVTNCPLCNSELLGIHPEDSTGHCIGCKACLSPWTETKYDATHHWLECSLGHVFDDEKEEHTFVGATCTEPGTCECGATGPADSALGHDYYWPRQTTKGQHEEKCRRCSYSAMENCTNDCENECECGRDATGHTEDIILPAEIATCKKPGKTMGKKCSVCGEITVEQDDVPQLEHQFTISATCEEPAKCGACGDADPENPALGHTKAEDSGYIAHTNGTTHGYRCGRCQENIRENHVFVGATCTADGKCVCNFVGGMLPHTPGAAATCTTAQLCVNCDKELTAALGHKWNDGVVTKEASYVDTGIITYTCLNDATHTYEEITPVKQYVADPNLDKVPRTGSAFLEWLYALIFA